MDGQVPGIPPALAAGMLRAAFRSGKLRFYRAGGQLRVRGSFQAPADLVPAGLAPDLGTVDAPAEVRFPGLPPGVTVDVESIRLDPAPPTPDQGGPGAAPRDPRKGGL